MARNSMDLTSFVGKLLKEDDSDILRAALGDPTAVDKPVEGWMAAPLPIVTSAEPLERVTRLLAARNPAVLVREDGAMLGILTRFDMLQFIAGGE